jgi:ParB/RepB/Spo0J family partition protein
MEKRLKRKITEVLLIKIDEPGVVDRMDIDPEKITELSESIDEVGLLQPILLRPVGERFEIVAGHRRFLACQRLGLPALDAVVKEMTDQEAAIIRASENLARENLTPLEESIIFSNLLTTYGMTLEAIAKKFGYKAGTIKRRLDLIKMPPQLKQAVHEKRISVSVAEELWPISDLTHLDYLLSYAIDGGCTKEVARAWCKDWRDQKRRSEDPATPGGQYFGPNEPRPVYVPCDLCTGPMEIGEETVLRLCKKCFKIIKENM